MAYIERRKWTTEDRLRGLELPSENPKNGKEDDISGIIFLFINIDFVELIIQLRKISVSEQQRPSWKSVERKWFLTRGTANKLYYFGNLLAQKKSTVGPFI